MAELKFSTVEEYLGSLDPVKAGTLRSIIDFILTEFPDLEAKIAWNIPQIHKDGKYVVGVCAYKHHLTYAPWSARVLDVFRPRLEKYPVFKNCFQIPVDWEIDKELIKDMLNARLAELE